MTAHTRPFPRLLPALLAVAGVLRCASPAAPGDLDPGFGSGGKVMTNFGNGIVGVTSVALQSDGKIVVAGYASVSNVDFAVARYHANGTLDTGFGVGGKVSTDVGATNDNAQSVAVQADGKILVAGRPAFVSNTPFVLVRYQTDGTLDSAFGNAGGKAYVFFGPSTEAGCYSVATQSDGRIVLAGYVFNGSTNNFAVARLNADGMLDSTFGSGGTVTTVIGSGDDSGRCVVVQSDGKIVVSGRSHNGANYDFALVRYEASGTLDSSFGSGGKVTTALGSGDDFGRGVVVQGDGKIVVTGFSDNGSNPDQFALVRYLADGTLDSSFGSGGKVNTTIGTTTDNASGLALQADGKIVVVGSVQVGSTRHFAVERYQGDVVPDALRQAVAGPGVAGDQFGTAVAISGTRMVVGASFDDSSAIDAGRVYVYDLSSGTATVPVVTLNNPDPAAGDAFGNAVAISGTRVVVGAYQDDTGEGNAGSAYVYDLASGTPTTPVAALNNPTPAANDLFGNSVAISGTRVVVGAGQDNTGGGNAGSAYVYDLASGTPTTPVATLNNPSPAQNDFFGWSVAISGARVVVGAYSYEISDTGRAFVYDLGSGMPTVPVATLNNPTPGAGDYFGWSVAISGTRVAVGAIGDIQGASKAGAAHVYDLASGTPTVPVATLNNPEPADFDSFGWSVAISGTRVVVGAYRDDTGAGDAGSAYVYELAGATPTQPVTTLRNPGPALGDQFGNSVAIDGATIVVGTPFDDTTATDAGFVYVFAPANPDYDGDGLLDLWEEARFGSITAHTATDDTDGDGRVELLEQAFDTDPLFSDPPTVLPQVVSEAGFLTITLGKRAGISYTVETAGSPGGAAFSMGTTTIITDNASTLKVRDNFTPATAGQRFMRVKVEPAP